MKNENIEFIFNNIDKAEMKMEELLDSDLYSEVLLYQNQTKTSFKVVAKK